jgi:cytochrome c-type biogenesis protein
VSIGSLMSSGPLLLAIPVAAAAGAVTFLSPCVLPLVPGYLSYITGMSGAAVTGSGTDGVDPADDDDPRDAAGTSNRIGDGTPPGSGPGGASIGVETVIPARTAARAVPVPTRRRAVGAAVLFVLGFAALFTVYGALFGALGQVGDALHADRVVLTRILGVVLILLGLLFAGVFDRFSFAGRILKPSFRPRAGLASAPLLGLLFGLGWTPCAGPTLTAILGLGFSTGTAAKSALLAFVYALGVGIPFLIVAFAVERGVTMFSFARRHARVITRVGGLLLVLVGVLEVTGAWSTAVAWLQAHWFGGYNAPI